MKLTSLVLLLAFSNFLQAQHYTYISDRRFFEPADMIGYDFKPSAMEIPEEERQEIDPGEYSFGITANNLYIKGKGIEGVYNINNMQPQEYGFKIFLMNARNARLQGHLKVIQNKYGMVEMLIFKRSANDKEIIFYLAPIPGRVLDQEKEYFTDRGELVIPDKDSIWGTTIYPFLILHKQENIQQRLQLADSTYITFTEETTIVEKEVKKKKKNKDDVATEEEGNENEEVETEVSEEMESDSTALDAPEIKVKITTEYFLTIHSYILTDGGGREKKTHQYPIRRINEKEDTSAGMQEERFMWEIANDKKEIINLYLNGDRTVSTLEVGDKKYFMRGF
ncbi:MAG: hypothetical protein R2788_06570 [Saprospiraceae bacterium]